MTSSRHSAQGHSTSGCALLLVWLGALGPGCAEPEDPPERAQVRVRAEPEDGVCQLEADAPNTKADHVKYVSEIGCRADFEYMAAAPTTSSVPGARSVKVVLDTADPEPQEPDKVYYQNSTYYQVHYDFVAVCDEILEHGPISDIATFGTTEYFEDDRRFILAAVTHYEPQHIWALEFAPYDTASDAMIERLYRALEESAYFGSVLTFHPTWDNAAERNKDLSPDIPVITNDELYAETDYQPLNLGTSVGQLRFLRAQDLETEYVSPKEIVVLDEVPNDISVVAGLITEQFQTPLSHVNVLAQNRGTPNMGLRSAFADPTLVALKGEWVQLTVSDRAYTVQKLTQAQADEWWEQNGPDPVDLPAPNTDPRELADTDEILSDDDSTRLVDKIHEATLAYGAKAANYAVLSAYQRLMPAGNPYNSVDGRSVIPTRKAFAIPVRYYMEFMRQNGLFDLFDRMVADPLFDSNPFVRDKLLAKLREAILSDNAKVPQELQDRLTAKLQADFQGQVMRFRSSTNAEDLDGFPCAGCYDSHTGDPDFWDEDLLFAIRQSWATVWKFRTYEEREFHRIDHKKVAMALLVHEHFPDEYANGVTVTNNPFNAAGNDPAFYINVQRGGAAEVVAPPVGVTTDMFLYYFYQPSAQGGLTLSFSSHSNLVADGEHVLDNTQTRILGEALNKINSLFSPAYGTGDWWAMDVEFKFNDEGTGTPVLWIKQARPYHGRGL